jgi:hypothetical protein
MYVRKGAAVATANIFILQTDSYDFNLGCATDPLSVE